MLHEVGAPLAIETVESRPPAATDVLVKVRAASICHTDLEMIEGGLPYPMPIVLGHEAAGVVVETGADVDGLAVGDPAVLSWNPHCGTCFYCEGGTPVLCESYTGNLMTGRHFAGGHGLRLNGAPLGVLAYLGGFADQSKMMSG